MTTRAFHVTTQFGGPGGIYFAESASKARYRAMLAYQDVHGAGCYGWFGNFAVRRAPRFDWHPFVDRWNFDAATRFVETLHPENTP